MGAETLLTLLGLLIAAYAILSPERQLDLKLRLKSLDWLVAAVALILIHYIQFYPVLSSLGLALNIGPWRWGFDSEKASYLIFLVTVGFIFVRIRIAKVGLGNIGSLQTLIERLVSEDRFSEVLFLLERHLPALFRVYNQDFTLVHFRERLEPKQSFHFHQMPTFLDRLKGGAARLLPNHRKEADIAVDTVRRVFVYDPFTSYLAKARPYFAFQVLDHKFCEGEDFLNLYIRALLRDKRSILYHEIKHNQSLATGRRYRIEEQNRLIHYFLSDARVAERVMLWRPFGDFALEYLDEQFRRKDADSYNMGLGNYSEDGCWECPLNATIWFFEAMILEALYQGIRWHMWLYYFPSIVEGILRNLSPDHRTTELGSEWPTPYHCLLYSIFNTLGGWIKSAADLPVVQENIVLRSEQFDHENSNIPKSAIIALGMCLGDVMVADSVDEHFRAYLLGVVLRNYFGLLKISTMQPFCRVLRDAIVKGGFSGYETDKKYAVNLRAALDKIDKIPFLGPEWTDLVQRVDERIV